MPKASEAFPELFIKPDRQGRVKTDTSSGRRMDKKIDELINRLNRLGFKRATVVNLNPFPVSMDLGYNGRQIIRGCKDGEPYVTYQIKKPLFHPIEKAEGDRDVDGIMPVEQAQEFIVAMRTSIFTDRIDDNSVEEGRLENVSIGLFWYEGLDEQFPEDLYNRARLLQQRWYEKLFEEAEDVWSKSKNRREIHDRMRDAARYMVKIGAISALPEWVTAKADIKGAEVKKASTKACDICGETVGVNAALCPKCNTMFQPDVVKKMRPDIYYAQRPNEAPKVKEPKGKPEEVAGAKE